MDTVHRLRLFFFGAWLVGAAFAGYLAGAGAVVLALWHPFAWMEAANAGHIDAVVALLGLWAAWMATRPFRDKVGPVLAGLAGGMAGAIKASFAPPFAAMLLALRRHPRQALAMGAVAAGVVASAYWLDWVPPHPFVGLQVEGRKTFMNFAHLVFIALARAGIGDPVARTIARVSGAVLFSGWALWALRRTRPSPKRLIEYAVATSVMASFALAPTAWPWHLLPAWLLASQLGPHNVWRRVTAVLIVSLTLACYATDLLRYALGTELLPGSVEPFERRTSTVWLCSTLCAWVPLFAIQCASLSETLHNLSALAKHPKDQ